MPRTLHAMTLLAVLFSALLPVAARAQATAAPAAPAAAPTPVPAQGDVSARVSDLERKLAEQAQTIAELKAASDASKAEVGELKDAVATASTDQDEAAFAQGGEEYSSKEPLSVYGFFDLRYLQGLWDKDSAFNLYFPSHGSFMMTNINLYFASQMTDTLEALVELRLSFMPQGWVGDNYVAEAYTATGVPLGTAGEWLRLDTTMRDPGTTAEFQQGGLTLERVHLTWAPVDWFKILAGRFLTPYGIWNVDHGSPVILTVVTPYMQLRELVPLAQTGLQVFGRFYPRNDLFLDYAVTLSNGRGALDSVMDLDDNKGVGLKLKLSYEGDKATAALGAYGYYGKYSDTQFHSHVILDPATGTMDDDVDKPLTYHEKVTNGYGEGVVSTDLLLELFGVRVQSEFIWRRIDVDHPRQLYSREMLFSGASILADHLFQASYTGWGYYVLLAYELPIANLLHGVRITPYAMWEDTRGYDTFPYVNFKLVTGGLNVKPSPYVTLKLEYMAAIPQSEVYGETLHAIQAQIAVSF